MNCPTCGNPIEDPSAECEEDLVTDHEPTALSGYRVDVGIGGEIVRFFGPCGNQRARVFRGTITRQIFNGLKSIESPVMKTYYIGDISVKMPRVFERLDNQGANRRFVAFYGQGAGNLVLEFLNGATISRDLEYLIRGAFPSKLSSPEEEDKEPENGRNGTEVESAECVGQEERDDDAGEPEPTGQGVDPEHGDASERTEDGKVLTTHETKITERELSEAEIFRRLTVQEPSPSKRPEEEPKPFTTIRKGGPMKNPPKQMYYRRPKGL